MPLVKPEVTIIIVHYNVKQELFECIKSIYGSNCKASFEIIVVDNDEKKHIKNDLLKKFPTVKYIENVNNGWGGGTNKGLKYAQGEYLYLLNPDTLLKKKAIDDVFKFAIANKKAGVVSSLLLDKNSKVYPLQGTKRLTPFNAFISLSFFNKYFPNSALSRNFWMKNWDRKKTREVEVATLSAALIKKGILEKVGLFDENYFLYYEEYDLAERLYRAGYKNYIVTSSKVIHLWEASAKKTGKTNEFMNSSREYYFKKHYGKVIGRSIYMGLKVGGNELFIGILILIFLYIFFAL